MLVNTLRFSKETLADHILEIFGKITKYSKEIRTLWGRGQVPVATYLDGWVAASLASMAYLKGVFGAGEMAGGMYSCAY